MSDLTAPKFVDIDAKAIEERLITRYEEMSGKKLYLAQVEHLFINEVAYAKTRMLAAIQHTGEQMLVRYSQEPMIDYLGELVGISRLPAQPATTILRWRLSVPLSTQLLIPALTGVTNENGNIAFITQQDVIITAGKLTADVIGICRETGTIGNGYLAGKINTSERFFHQNLSVTNLTETSDGSERETNSSLAERIILAPESFSTAGSEGAYISHTRKVHQSIIAVNVQNHEDDQTIPPGEVHIFPLTTEGLPSEALLTQIEQYLSREKVRPLNDTVRAKSPIKVEYQINASLTLFKDADKDLVLEQAKAVITKWTTENHLKLGRDIVPKQIEAILAVSGVYEVTLTLPGKQIIKNNEWAYCNAINIQFGGVSDD